MSQNDNPFGALKSLVEKGQIQTKAWVPTSSGSKKPTAAALRYADASVKKAFEESTSQQNRKESEPEKPAAKPENKPAPRARAVRRETQAVKMPEKQLIERKHESKRAISKAQQVKDQSKTQPTRMKAERRVLKTVQPDSANESSRRELMPVAQTRRSPFVPPNPITKPVMLAPGLPVSEHGEELVKAIQENPVIVVCGETGSGKTTQLPKICLLAGRGTKGLIGHTQPRRIAASSIAKRIAAELESEVGEIVGYKVRFTDKTMPGAAIKLMTDGILLAETQTDPLLKRYDTIIIDEAHERSINIDFLLGYLKRVLAKRKDLKVIITSATIDAERFAKHFEINGKPAPVFTISGRTYPVQIRWRPVDDTDETDDKTLMDAVADACDELQIAGRGDILVFLPGEREIREAAEVLRV